MFRNNFTDEFRNATPEQRISLLQNLLKDKEQAAVILAKEADMIYCHHPVMIYFMPCEKAAYPARKQLAEEIIKNYGKDLIFYDLEYLCENFPELRENLLIDLAGNFTSDILKTNMLIVLENKKPIEAVIFAASTLNKISSSAHKHNIGGLSLAALSSADQFLKPEACQWLCDKYIKTLLNDTHWISQCGFSINHLTEHLALLNKYLSQRELLNFVRAMTANTITGTADGMTYYYLPKLQPQVTADLFLKILDKMSRTYDDLASGAMKLLPGFPANFAPQLAPIYKAKLHEYFKKQFGYSIEDYRRIQDSLNNVYTNPALAAKTMFGSKQLQVEIPVSTNDTQIICYPGTNILRGA